MVIRCLVLVATSRSANVLAGPLVGGKTAVMLIVLGILDDWDIYDVG